MRPRRPLTILAALIAALALVGCGAVAQFQQPCPGYINISEPVWSPDSTKLAYMIRETMESKGLYITDLPTDSTTRLADLHIHAASPVWSPDGQRLLTAFPSDESTQLQVVEINGAQRQLPTQLVGQVDFQWSLGGEFIAIPSQNDLLIIDSDGVVQWRYSDVHIEENTLIGNMSWSPDSKHIAFILYKLAQGYLESAHVAVVERNGDNLTVFSPLADLQLLRDIQWSVDGSLIAFISYEEPVDTTLNVITADGRQHKSLVRDVYWNFVWLPDRNALIYLTSDDKIYQIDADSESEPILIGESNKDRFMSFSPDGSKLAYTVQGNVGEFDLYVKNIDGTDVQQITHNPGNTMCFHWPF